MSSKAAKRRAEVEKRQEKRQERERKKRALFEADTIEEVAAILGVKLK